MPHVIVKLWPGKSEEKKTEIAERIAQDVMSVLDYCDDAVSVSIEEISPSDWMDEVYRPDIADKPSTLYKKPGY